MRHSLLASATAAILAAMSITVVNAAPNGTALSARDISLAREALSSPFAAGIRSVIVVDAASQRLVLWQDREAKCAFPVSTAKAGTGNKEGSGKTPLGWHRVAEWIGGEAEPGQVFVSRAKTGEILPESLWRSTLDDDKVLTRIMWLEGLEPGKNSGPGIDSHDRFIYIHGTNQEHLLGSPASHGCIRLSNRNAIELFRFTDGTETLCLIAE